MPTPTPAHDAPTPLLAGLSPARFMQRHWQRRPLLIRQALPGVAPPVSRAELFALAQREGVECRLVQHAGGQWTLRQGPLPRRALPPVSRPGWTLLVQGVDLHDDAAHALLHRFDFLPGARLDDLMVSWASDGGGVGPHVDSYDVFLLQVQGRRHWRIRRPGDETCLPDAPLRVLRHFEPEQEWTLEPGDMLYLPPGWAHEGTAVGACMTCSIGFRAPRRDELAREVLLRVLEAAAQDEAPPAAARALYRDAGQAATATPGAIPPALLGFAADAVRRALASPGDLARALGEYLSEPKPTVWFEPDGQTDLDALPEDGALVLDRRSRMLYDDRCLYLNGEAFHVGGRDARLLRRWADQRRLTLRDARSLSAQAREVLQTWLDDGWIRLAPPPPQGA